MSFELPDLPYAYKALEPHISARTLEFHHDKHHAGYVSKLNAAVKDTPRADMTLERVIQDTAGKADAQGVFNNAAQTWNHTFLWHSMSPEGGGKPSGDLARLVDEAFGSVDKFREDFKKEAAGRFGSGWTWLVVDGGKLAITSTLNADTPIAHGGHALLTLDVWEHAYYLDYQNDRAAYIDAFLDRLINWEFAAANLKGGAGGQQSHAAR